MNILASLQNRKVGLIQLILMGLYVYLKNWKPILLFFSILDLPFIIVFAIFLSQSQNISLGKLLLFILIFLVVYIFPSIANFVAIAVITNTSLQDLHTSYQSILREIKTSLIPLLSLKFQFGFGYSIVCLLTLPFTIIPIFLLFYLFWVSDASIFSLLAAYVFNGTGIIYAVSNGYYDLAFILREKSGQEAFDYSCSVVEGNWWRVFYWIMFSDLVRRGFVAILRQVRNNLPLNTTFFIYLLSLTILVLTGTVIQISSILLFLNLDYRKSVEN